MNRDHERLDVYFEAQVRQMSGCHIGWVSVGHLHTSPMRSVRMGRRLDASQKVKAHLPIAPRAEMRKGQVCIGV